MRLQIIIINYKLFYCHDVIEVRLSCNRNNIYPYDDVDDVKVYSSFVAWQRDQPDNNYHGNRSPYQSCVALNIVDRSTFGWTDENCAHTTFWTGQLTKRYGHLCRYGGHTFHLIAISVFVYNCSQPIFKHSHIAVVIINHFLATQAHRLALIFVPIALSQTPSEALLPI